MEIDKSELIKTAECYNLDITLITNILKLSDDLDSFHERINDYIGFLPKPKPKTAELDLDLFKADLKALLVKHNVTIGADIDGDTHGISTKFIVCGGTPYSEHTLVLYTSYLDSSDL